MCPKYDFLSKNHVKIKSIIYALVKNKICRKNSKFSPFRIFGIKLQTQKKLADVRRNKIKI